MTLFQEFKSEEVLAAVLRVLKAKEILTDDELVAQMASADSANPGQGARMVAKAWLDPAYKSQMLTNGTRAAEMIGIPMLGMPPLGVLENVGNIHNLVVCTLCSCYPRAVLGYPPYWFKSATYRSRAVRDPRGLLAAFNTTLADNVIINVVDSTADYRWMVLPQRPEGTDGWSEDQLAKIVTLGDMIGVSLPRA